MTLDPLIISRPTVKAEFFSRQADRINHILDRLILERRDPQFLSDPPGHLLVLLAPVVNVLPDILDIFPLQGSNGLSSGQFTNGASGQSKSTREHQRRTGGADMDLFGPTFPKFLDGIVFQLRSSNNRILTEDNPVPLDNFLDGD